MCLHDLLPHASKRCFSVQHSLHMTAASCISKHLLGYAHLFYGMGKDNTWATLQALSLTHELRLPDDDLPSYAFPSAVGNTRTNQYVAGVGELIGTFLPNLWSACLVCRAM